MCISITKCVVTVGKGVCRLSNASFLPANKHGVPVPRLPLAWLSRLFSKWAKGSGRFRKNQARKTKIDTRDAVCTNAKKKGILEAGFERVECQEHNFHKRPIYLKNKTETFPYAIASDFKALLGASKRPQGTKDLLFENEQVPASASLADTLNKEPEHISSKDPEELIRKFREVLERRAAAIREGEGFLFSAGAAAKAYKPMVFPESSSMFQLRTL